MGQPHVFVDESRRDHYLLAAVPIDPTSLDEARKAIRALHLRGQRRLHMVKESPARQGRIIATIAELGIGATLYEASSRYRNDGQRRAACLTGLLEDADRQGGARIVIEDGERERDRRVLFQESQRLGCEERVTYLHLTASEEPLLAIPDAIAWSVARGRDARRRVAPLIRQIISV